MAHATTSVTSALPKIGICPVTFKTGPTIRILNMPSLGGHIVAYDKHTWTADQIDGLMRLHLGDYELVQPAAEDGA